MARLFAKRSCFPWHAIFALTSLLFASTSAVIRARLFANFSIKAFDTTFTARAIITTTLLTCTILRTFFTNTGACFIEPGIVSRIASCGASGITIAGPNTELRTFFLAVTTIPTRLAPSLTKAIFFCTAAPDAM